VTNGQQNRIFGSRKQQHILILASGDKVRHMTIKPWMAALGICSVGVFAMGYLLATSYLVLRDDLIGATMARQARMQHDYEDRIAALRAQVDRVTSRQLLDQQVVEDKVDKLMEQQMALTSRHGKLGSLLDRAESSGLSGKDDPAPIQSYAPETKGKHASLTGGAEAIEKMLAGNEGPADATPDNSTLAYVPAQETVGDRADRVFSKVTLSLKDVEQEQRNRIEQLTSDAGDTTSAIENVLSRFKIAVPGETSSSKTNTDDSAVGGPFVEPESDDDFNNSLAQLDTALTRLEQVRTTAQSLPFRNPAIGKEITSPFGNRRDPFLGRLALHAGVDFRFAPGEKVRPTAPGKVTNAGWMGGYGNMIEVDHGNGISTRYGHMSQVLVKVGDTVDCSDIIGLAGSTGRSTGTHLHYEVRQDGRAIDPMYFMNAGVKLASYMK
jgi:murein DD-endopeptidase MepM/ murein hydrolase activator NlpD